jgi:hypothetical protein
MCLLFTDPIAEVTPDARERTLLMLHGRSRGFLFFVEDADKFLHGFLLLVGKSGDQVQKGLE